MYIEKVGIKPLRFLPAKFSMGKKSYPTKAMSSSAIGCSDDMGESKTLPHITKGVGG